MLQWRAVGLGVLAELLVTGGLLLADVAILNGGIGFVGGVIVGYVAAAGLARAALHGLITGELAGMVVFVSYQSIVQQWSYAQFLVFDYRFFAAVLLWGGVYAAGGTLGAVIGDLIASLMPGYRYR